MAAGLLAALGDPSHAGILVDPRHRDAILWPLAALGRALTPCRGDIVAQPHIEEMQAQLLRRILTTVLADGKPASMIVMPQNAPSEREVDETRRLFDLLREGAGPQE